MTGPSMPSPTPAALDELGQGAAAAGGAKLESLLDMMLPVGPLDF